MFAVVMDFLYVVFVSYFNIVDQVQADSECEVYRPRNSTSLSDVTVATDDNGYTDFLQYALHAAGEGVGTVNCRWGCCGFRDDPCCSFPTWRMVALVAGITGLVAVVFLFVQWKKKKSAPAEGEIPVSCPFLKRSRFHNRQHDGDQETHRCSPVYRPSARSNETPDENSIPLQNYMNDNLSSFSSVREGSSSVAIYQKTTTLSSLNSGVTARSPADVGETDTTCTTGYDTDICRFSSIDPPSSCDEFGTPACPLHSTTIDISHHIRNIEQRNGNVSKTSAVRGRQRDHRKVGSSRRICDSLSPRREPEGNSFSTK